MNLQEIESMPFYKTVKIYNFLDETLPVSLQDNKGYIVANEYVSANEETAMTMMACDSIDCRPGNLGIRAIEGTPRFGPILAIGNDNLDVDFSTNGFGRSLVPVVRMNVGRSASSSTKDVMLDDSNKVLAYPNPANQSVRRPRPPHRRAFLPATGIRRRRLRASTGYARRSQQRGERRC